MLRRSLPYQQPRERFKGYSLVISAPFWFIWGIFGTCPFLNFSVLPPFVPKMFPSFFATVPKKFPKSERAFSTAIKNIEFYSVRWAVIFLPQIAASCS
jgi:hypothetical protein